MGRRKTFGHDYLASHVGAKQGYVISGMVEGGVAYRLFPFLSLDLGVVFLDSPQMYFNDTGRVDAPLHDLPTDYTLRYSMFHGMGPSLGLAYVYSPIPRLNLGLRASGFMLTDHYLEHWFMGMPVWDVAPDEVSPATSATVDVVLKDLSVYGKEYVPPMGASGSFKADYLISRRLSLSLELGYFWMPPYLPVIFQVGDTMQNSNQDEGALSYIDKNGTFAIMGGYNVARIDGTPASGYISYDPSGLTASLSLAIHF